MLDFLIVGVDLLLLGLGLIIGNMPNISVLRVFRLVRLARAFKAASFFNELNCLIRSFACAMKAIFWGILMILLCLTVWGILAVQLIHPINERVMVKHPDLYEGCDRCPRAFETVFNSGLTFFQQLVAGDSWGTVSNPIVEEAPWTFLMFLMVLVTVNLTMLNLILAVIVEAGSAAAAQDEHRKAMEMHREVIKAESKLIDICQTLDADQSGSLSIEEFMDGFHQNVEFKECLEVMHVTSIDDLQMIFNICDDDDSGDVNYHEFVEQLRRIKNSGSELLLHYVTDIRHALTSLRNQLNSLGMAIKKPKTQRSGTQSLPLKADSKQDVKQDSRLASEASLAAAPKDKCDSGQILRQDSLFNSQDTSRSNELLGSEQSKANMASFISESKDSVPYMAVSDDMLNRILRLNEDLHSMAKVQTGLLSSLVENWNPPEEKNWLLNSPLVERQSSPALPNSASNSSLRSFPGYAQLATRSTDGTRSTDKTGSGINIVGSAPKPPGMCGIPAPCCVRAITPEPIQS